MLKAFALVFAAAVPPVDPPTDAEVLRTLPQLGPRVPREYEVFRDDIIIVKETVARVAHTFNLPGGAPVTVVDTSWRCTTHYTEVVETRFLIPVRFERKRVQVVFIQKSHVAD